MTNDWYIDCIRGGNSNFARRCDNGDKLDSNLYVYKDLELKETFNFVNTDHTNGYNGGILKEGLYDFIIGDWKGKYLAAIICQNLLSTDTWDKLTADKLTLPSIVSNPNHGGRKVMDYVWMHKTMGDFDGDGMPDADGSRGCITIYAPDFIKFSSLFKLNDRGKFKLERNPVWTPPAFYEG